MLICRDRPQKSLLCLLLAGPCTLRDSDTKVLPIFQNIADRVVATVWATHSPGAKSLLSDDLSSHCTQVICYPPPHFRISAFDPEDGIGLAGLQLADARLSQDAEAALTCCVDHGLIGTIVNPNAEGRAGAHLEVLAM
jgi:hypothetical protein